MKRSVHGVVAGLLVIIGYLGVQPRAEASLGALYYTLAIGNTIDGVDYDANDILKYDTVSGATSLFFDASSLFPPTSINNSYHDNHDRIDALYIFPNGDFLLSTDKNTSIGSLNFQKNDLVRVDPVTKAASIFLDGATTFQGVQDVQAVDVLDNGKLVIAADGGKIGTNELEFGPRDLVLYDPVSGNAALFFNGDDHFEGKQGAIAAVDVLPDGQLLLAVRDDVDALIGGGIHVDRKDIFLYNPVTKHAEIVLDGRDNYFQRTSHEHDQGFASVFVPPSDTPPVVPEPVTSSLFGIGLLGASVFSRRKRFVA